MKVAKGIQSRIILYERLVFSVLLLFLPANLGYHFVSKSSYVHGILSDYLIPTLYLQDILVVILLALSFPRWLPSKIDKYLVWFLFCVFLSVTISGFLISSIAGYFRLVLSVAFMLYVKSTYVWKKDKYFFLTVIGIGVFIFSMWGLLQWCKQGSLFNNYLFLGEQPYSVSTRGINVENFFGKKVVPPYGTFRHPNVFAAYLCIFLFWIISGVGKKKLLIFPLITGLLTLFLTVSLFTWIIFLLGIVFICLNGRIKQRKVHTFAMRLVVITLMFLPLIPLPRNIREHPSYYRRRDLLVSSYHVIKENPLFGVGYQSSGAVLEMEAIQKRDFYFAQPVHNIFVLIWVEAGTFALFFLCLYLGNLIKRYNDHILFLSVYQILLLGSFDHYFFSAHQAQYIMWLIFGLI